MSKNSRDLKIDDWGQLRSLTNALNEATTYTFSEGGLLLTERLPNGTENRYDYDATGQLGSYDVYTQIFLIALLKN